MNSNLSERRIRWRELLTAHVIGEVITMNGYTPTDCVKRAAHDLGITVRTKRLSNKLRIVWRTT